MDNAILTLKAEGFKCFERGIYTEKLKECVAETVDTLKQFDDQLLEEAKQLGWRNKGFRNTTVRTVFGEVEFRRRVYEEVNEKGEKSYRYILDERLGLGKIGEISENLADVVVKLASVESFKACSEDIAELTGEYLSPSGVWGILQKAGEEITAREDQLVKINTECELQGNIESDVLFEEADGIYIPLQGKERKKTGKRSEEIKSSISYTAWKEEGKNRFSLQNALSVAGIENSKDFQMRREAVIANKYNLTSVTARILNGDGGAWIKQVVDDSTIFQLDPFHRNKAITSLVHDPKAAAKIKGLINEGKIDDMFSFLRMYIDSIDDSEETSNAEELYSYLKNNEDGLLDYRIQEPCLPDCPAGFVYRNLGTMENHNSLIIARRMKHNHTTWSKKGANNMAKILAAKFSGSLNEAVHDIFAHDLTNNNTEKPLKRRTRTSCGRIAKREGKGYEYPVKGSFTPVQGPLKGTWANISGINGT